MIVDDAGGMDLGDVRFRPVLDRQLTPRVAATLPLAQVAVAHERVAAGGIRGRIVLTLDD